MKIRVWFGLIILPCGFAVAAWGANPTDSMWYSPPPRSAINEDASDVQINPDVLVAQQPNTAPLRAPTPPAPPTPRATRPNADGLALAPPPSAFNQRGALSLASTTTGYSLASTPNMFGDTLGVGFFFVVENPAKPGQIAGNVPIGGGSVKISEDCSPLPVDRVFFDYNHFQNALLTADGADIALDRYTMGVEKTFFDGNASVEIKAPIDSGLNDVQYVNGPTSANEGTLFGTLAITPKVLLHQSDGWAASAGLAIGLPTSPNVELQTNQQPFRVFDDSVHLAPFLGLLLTPNERWFSITYLQLDFDSNGNRTFVGDNPVGRLRSPTLMYVDCSVGYWLFYNQPSESGVGHYLTGLAPVVELHYTTTLQNAEGVGGIIEPVSQRVDILNITGGLFFKIGPSAGLTVGGVAPLRTRPSDKEFDAEVLVQFNRWF
jgi:hypothetical protein